MPNIRQELLRALRYCYQEGLIWGKTGCISARAGGTKFYITPKGASYDDMLENSIGLYDWNKKRWMGQGLPPLEVRIHRELYKDHEQISALVHCQPVFSTLIACSDVKPDKNIISVSATLLNNIIEIPYNFEGSDELYTAIKERSINNDIFLIKNFGIIVAGKSIKDAIDKTITFEFICKLQIYSGSANVRLTPLSEEVVLSIRDYYKKQQNVFSF